MFVKDHIQDKNIYGKFTRLYILALTAVAFLSILGQLLIQQTLNHQENDSWIINYAGRQRFQSQAITKNILVLADRSEKVDTSQYLADLRRILNSWTRYHYELRSGNLHDKKVSVPNSAKVQQMFNTLESSFSAIRQSADQVLASSARSDSAVIEAAAKEVLQHEKAFLQQMDAIVSQYEYEARAKVDRLRQIEAGLLGITLVVLMAEALLVFRPAVVKLRQTVLALIEARMQTLEMNEELKALNQSLEETREELLTATRQKYHQQLEEQRSKMSYLIQGQEEERKRLARDLHDDLGQMLTALKLGIENMTGQAQWTPKGERLMDELKQLVAQTIAEVRTISFNLMPAVLNDFGITSALRLLSSQLTSSTGIQVIFDSNMTNDRLPKEIEIALYRIAQEGLNNAIKYAKTNQIQMQLSVKKKQVWLTIIDEGVGFNYSGYQQKSHKDGVFHGLHHIQERARLISGEAKIASEIGIGTNIRVKVPLGNSELKS